MIIPELHNDFHDLGEDNLQEDSPNSVLELGVFVFKNVADQLADEPNDSGLRDVLLCPNHLLCL